jgi:NADPH-dependent 2,4-dienoyl-CoA reductase/sulfur reductase-like enzyme
MHDPDKACGRKSSAAGWSRPARFDRNLIVIGAGAGGLVASYIAATVRAKVTLVERARMGGPPRSPIPFQSDQTGRERV